MIDTHAHLNLQAFEDDYLQVLKENFERGLKAVINVGSNLETSEKAIRISQEFSAKGGPPAGGCYASVGLHPIHAEDEEFDGKKYEELIEKNKDKVKAVGETGLDFYHSKKNAEKQKEIFLKHVELAREFDLAVILHCRGSRENPKDAYLELLRMVKGLKQKPSGVLHCFSSDREIAREFLKLGFYLGFDGPITFKNATQELLKVVEETPLDKILLETDCPLLAPEPFRGQRNQPVYVRFVARKIAELKNVSFSQVVETTTESAKKLFRL